METVEQLLNFMEVNKLSQASVARSLGISGAALNQWISGRYEGDNKKIAQDVRSFLKRAKRREKNPKRAFKFIMTSSAQTVFDAAETCHLEGEIGVAYGDAGVGKTCAAKEYAAQNGDVILVEADLGYTAKDLFSELHKKCGGDGAGTIGRMKDDVINRLKGSGRLIIIDEAEHLPVRAIDLVRRVNDKAGVGILFLGLRRLWDGLIKRKRDYAYILSRIGLAVNIDQLDGEDVRAIVNDLVPGYNGIWKVYHDHSQGNARVLGKLISRSVRISEISNARISPEVIREAAKMLMI